MNKKVLFVGLLAGCFGMNAFAATEIYAPRRVTTVTTALRGKPLIKPCNMR